MANREKQLRCGFTTGTAAAAAAKAAVRLIATGELPAEVSIQLLTGESLTIPVLKGRLISSRQAVCAVIKDAGDDPDVTHKAEIGAKVTLTTANETPQIDISGGVGVGVVTKPGLEVPPGEPAINPGPRRMIRRSVTEALEDDAGSCSVSVEIFVPEGERLARNTLNARLGILGGISILGTTGLVRPLSHDAYTATIRSAMSVARAEKIRHIVLTTGRRSEKYAQRMMPHAPETAFIQMGDFFEYALKTASEMGFASVCLTVFFGKALKMAQGFGHTHAAKAPMTLTALADWTLARTGDHTLADRIRHANTARHAFDMVYPTVPEILRVVGRRMIDAARNFSAPSLDIRGMILDYAGQPIFDSKQTAERIAQRADRS